jgi:hypothetical protein
MVLNTTINNISVISWQSVLLVEESRVPRENHRPVASYLAMSGVGFKLTTLMVIGPDCKSNYHTITTMMAPRLMDV